MIRYRKDKVAILRLMSGTAHSEPLWRLQGFVCARTFNNNPARVRPAERKQVFSQQPLFKLASPPQCAGHTLPLLMRRSTEKPPRCSGRHNGRGPPLPLPYFISFPSLTLPLHKYSTKKSSPQLCTLAPPKLSQTSKCPPTLQHPHVGLGRLTGD